MHLSASIDKSDVEGTFGKDEGVIGSHDAKLLHWVERSIEAIDRFVNGWMLP